MFDCMLIMEEDCRVVEVLCCGGAESFDRVMHLAEEASRGLLRVICKRRYRRV